MRSSFRAVVIALCFEGALASSANLARADDQASRLRVENVVVVTWDGFRPEEMFGGAQDAILDKKAGGVDDVPGLTQRYGTGSPAARREALLPFVWGTIAKQGQIFGDRSTGAPARLTNGKKFSYPGYNEMFCGFGDDRIDSNAKKPNPNQSVLEFLDIHPKFRGKVAAFCTWDVFHSIFRSDQNGLKVHTGFSPIVDDPLTDRQKLINTMVEGLPRIWPDNGFDAITLESAREHLIRHKPRVLFIGLGETDEWAHLRRYDLYLQAAHESDRALDSLWRTLQSLPEYADKTALILTTDHGRGTTPANWPDHGPKVEGAEYVWIAVLAPGVTPSLGIRSQLETTQSQVAATIAHLLGENFNEAGPRAAPPLPNILPSDPTAQK